jgi:hypothetical protein
MLWGWEPRILLQSGRYSSFDELVMMSIAGANFSSMNPDDQGIVPERVEKLKNYFHFTPPQVFVYYHVKDNSPIKALVHRNLDFRVAPYLRFVKDLLDQHYVLKLVVPGKFDEAQIYIRTGAAAGNTDMGAAPGCC